MMAIVSMLPAEVADLVREPSETMASTEIRAIDRSPERLKSDDLASLLYSVINVQSRVFNQETLLAKKLYLPNRGVINYKPSKYSLLCSIFSRFVLRS